MADETLSIYIVCTSASGLSVIFNAVGIYVLLKTDFRNSNQILIIKNLSISDIVCSVAWLVLDTTVLYLNNNDEDIKDRLWIAVSTLYITWVLFIFLLNIDRFIGINFPFRYKIILTKKTILRAIASIWFLGTVNSILCVIFVSEAMVKNILLIWLALDGIFMILFVTTYTTICLRVTKTKLKRNRVSQKNDNHKLFWMVFCMLAAFVLLEIVPNIATILIYHFQRDQLHMLSMYLSICYRANLLVDPIIYVFLQPRARHTFTTILRSTICCKADISTEEGPSSIRPTFVKSAATISSITSRV